METRYITSWDSSLTPAFQRGMHCERQLRYLTSSNNRCIESGMRADLVLLAEDPILDIRATRTIQRVWWRGVEVAGPKGRTDSAAF
jgi:hypothetical protein